MPEVVKLREVTDRRDVVHRAVQRLVAGELVALPSEAGSVFAAAALSQSAVARLVRSGPANNVANVVTLLLRGDEETADYLPHLPKVGRRFARRCWPGPLALRAAATSASGFLQALPDGTRNALLADGDLSVRVSSHPVLSEVAKLTRGPLVLRELEGLPRSEVFDQPEWRDVSLIVHEGPASGGGRASVVRVDSQGWSVVHEGILDQNRLQLAACELLVFVCTGNTCRSPMAEALCRQMLSERLKCSVPELIQRGFLVASAGLAADYGLPASPESVEMMRRRGIDLRSHASQPMSERLIEQSDRCYTMTQHHRNWILEHHPETAGRVQLLSRDGTDISDPIGGGRDDYAACAASIEKHLAKILDEVL